MAHSEDIVVRITIWVSLVRHFGEPWAAWLEPLSLELSNNSSTELEPGALRPNRMHYFLVPNICNLHVSKRINYSLVCV